MNKKVEAELVEAKRERAEHVAEFFKELPHASHEDLLDVEQAIPAVPEEKPQAAPAAREASSGILRRVVLERAGRGGIWGLLSRIFG